LVADLLMIVTVFSGRMDGQRAKSLQKCMTSRIQACLQEAEALDGTN
jgi:predicted site-specific integrase-resolvase